MCLQNPSLYFCFENWSLFAFLLAFTVACSEKSGRKSKCVLFTKSGNQSLIMCNQKKRKSFTCDKTKGVFNDERMEYFIYVQQFIPLTSISLDQHFVV